MTIERSRRPVGVARIVATTRRLLDASTLCAVATSTPDGRPYVNTAYFAWDEDFRLVWLSHPDAAHSVNLSRRSSAAIAVYESTQSWGEEDRGVQLFGAAKAVRGAAAKAAERLYSERFASFAATGPGAYRFYVFRPRRLKLFDECEFGAGTFVTARVATRGRIEWERTEIYGVSA